MREKITFECLTEYYGFGHFRGPHGFLATFEDNKIQSAEVASESDKFIHIIYGVFYS